MSFLNGWAKPSLKYNFVSFEDLSTKLGRDVELKCDSKFEVMTSQLMTPYETHKFSLLIWKLFLPVLEGNHQDELNATNRLSLSQKLHEAASQI